MSNSNSMLGREQKKNQLRQQMLSSQNRMSSKRGQDSEEVAEKAVKKVPGKRLLMLTVVAALLGTAGFGYYQYQKHYQFSDYKINWEIPVTEGSYVGYEYFGTNVLKYTKDGASYSDNQGNTVWTQSYEMKAPIISVKDGYAAIADQRGNKICIFNKDGFLGTATTVLPISHVAVAGNGLVAVVIEEATASYITFFTRDGRSFGLFIKIVMSGDGYPMDISLSHDGTQLICSCVYLAGGEMKSRVVFYDFSEIGKEVPTRIVGGFDEIFGGDKVAARVCYLGEPYSCAFTGSGLAFFSSRNLASPELMKEVPVEEEIQSIFYSDEYVAIIAKTGKGDYPSRLSVFRKTGEPVMSREFDYDYRYADIDEDLVLLYNEESCQVYNLSGVLKLNAAFDFPVTKIRKGRFPNTLIVTGPQNMKEIKMQ